MSGTRFARAVAIAMPAAVAIAIGVAPDPSDAVELPSQTPPALQGISDCVKANEPGRTLHQRLELKVFDREGVGRSSTLDASWIRYDDGLARILLRVSAPAPLRGASFLVHEQQGRGPDLYHAEPGPGELRSLAPTAAAGPLFGSNFTYEDFWRIQNLARLAGSTIVADTEVDGRVAWQIETIPAAGAGSAYRRIVSAIDKERCVPLRVRFYREGPEPVKLLLVPAADVSGAGGGWLPKSFTMKDLDRATHSRLVVLDAELDIEMTDGRFDAPARDEAP